ncbi:hypothetical protein BU17DRAFT_58239 [Hysterangium stoloniferum]|nr:hypothetical protein BU17DRAFT_58239 [Hysterangium stoloniferum]
MKQTQRSPESNSVPVISRDELTYPYAAQRNQAPWRSHSTPYPSTQSYVYKTYPASRPSYTPSSPSARIPQSYSPGPSGQSPTLAVQPPTSPAQVLGPPRELCLECMMRDEDMADVDVTSPGVWDRESDVWYKELCQREEDEERDRSQHPSSSSGLSSSTGCVRPRARGAKLTEGNLIVWLNLNPPEPASRQQTLNTYLDTQNHLLLAEHKARLQAMQESRQLDEKMRDTYSELRRSAYDLGASASALDDGGIKIRSPNNTAFGDDARHPYKRDTTLLENGMIIERVDVRKEEARIRKDERRARKASRDSLTLVDNRDRERDAMSLYSFQAVEGPASIRSPAPYESTISVPIPTSRSVRSMYTTPSSSWQQTIPNRPVSMAPGSIPGFASQTSLVSTGSPRRRFFGMRQWSGYFGSNVSLAQSGSMVDMHLGLDQDKQFAQARQVDIGSNAPSLREKWPHDENKGRHNVKISSPISPKKKKRGIGRLWKIITGSSAKVQETAHITGRPSHELEDEDLPLAPPPPLSYLVNRSSVQSERSMNIVGSGRHVSMPSLSFSNGGHQPRSNSVRSTVGVSLSSPSDQSSTLPSPTELRFPHRDSGGDSREDAHYDEDSDTINRKKSSGLETSPSRPFIANISEPNFHANAAAPASPPVSSLDKSLPPLPLDDPDVPPPNSCNDRSRDHIPSQIIMPLESYEQRTFSTPNAGYRFEDAARRQSFNGLTSRSALPLGAGRAIIPGVVYNEFGDSRHSLAVFDPIPNAANKRKSRFGLSSLLGRKETPSKHRRDASITTLPNARSHPRNSEFLGQTRTSLSEQSSLQPMLQVSRRTLEERVLQESDFLAYRYPSKDERLDLSRG